MDYETHIDIKQYHPQGMFYYTLEILHLENGDFTYEGECLTLNDVMDCIKLHLKTTPDLK
jgi:hypothetical protein